MNTNKDGQGAAKRIETWEQLRERLFRLAELGDELASMVTGPGATWLYREIEADAAAIAEVAGAYVEECERSDRAPTGGGDRPAWLGASPTGRTGTTRTTSGRALPATVSRKRCGELDGGER